MEHWAAILQAVAGSPYGVVALFMLVSGLLIVPLVPAPRRFPTVVLVLFLNAGLAVYGIYTVEATRLFPGAALAREPMPPAPAEPPRARIEPGAEAGPPAPQRTRSLGPMATPAQPAPRPAVSPQRVDCGTAWSGWTRAGTVAEDPCPTGCRRGEALGETLRVVGFPPSVQSRQLFQCWR